MHRKAHNTHTARNCIRFINAYRICGADACSCLRGRPKARNALPCTCKITLTHDMPLQTPNRIGRINGWHTFQTALLICRWAIVCDPIGQFVDLLLDSHAVMHLQWKTSSGPSSVMSYKFSFVYICLHYTAILSYRAPVNLYESGLLQVICTWSRTLPLYICIIVCQHETVTMN